MNERIQPTMAGRKGAKTLVSCRTVFHPADPLDRLAFSVLLLVVATIPTEDALIVSEDLGVVHVIAALAFCLTALTVVRRGRLSRINVSLALMTWFVLWAFASALWGASPVEALKRAATYGQLLLLFWIITELASDHGRVKLLLTSYLVGNLIPLSAIIYNSVIGVSFWGGRYIMIGADPNDTALSLAIGMTVALYLSTASSSVVIRRVGVLYVPLALYGILLTGSRGGLLASAAGVLLFAVSALARLRRTAAPVLVVGVIIALALPAVLATLPLGLEARFSKIPEQLQNGGLSSRRRIWAVGIETFLDHPVCGVGAGNFIFYSGDVLGKPYVEHNAFLAVAVEEGLIGATLYFGALLLLWRLIPRLLVPERRFYGSVFACWFVGAFALTWDYRKITWFLIATASAQVRLLHNVRPTQGGEGAFNTERGMLCVPLSSNVPHVWPGSRR